MAIEDGIYMANRGTTSGHRGNTVRHKVWRNGDKSNSVSSDQTTYLEGNFTEEDLLQEIATSVGAEKRLPGDVDANQISKKLGIRPKSVGPVMRRIEEDGKIKRVRVLDKGRWIMIWRK